MQPFPLRINLTQIDLNIHRRGQLRSDMITPGIDIGQYDISQAKKSYRQQKIDRKQGFAEGAKESV